jgi:hypothetical protein
MWDRAIAQSRMNNITRDIDGDCPPDSVTELVTAHHYLMMQALGEMICGKTPAHAVKI